MSDTLTDEELRELRASAVSDDAIEGRDAGADRYALCGSGPLVLRLLNENARLKRDIEAEQAETFALMERGSGGPWRTP